MEFVAILVIVLGVLLVAFLILLDRINQLTGRVVRLEWDLKEALRNQIAADHDLASNRESAPSPPLADRPAPPPPVSMSPAPPSVQLSSPPPVTVSKIEVEQPPSRTRQEWEAVIGGKLLNRIGALALILGAGFFLKYAFDNDWISEPIRVLIGIAIGTILLFFGARSHRKGLAVFAQGIQGAGIAILYLSVYATCGFYHLLPQPVAFAGMALVTAVAFLVGLRYESQPAALLGWLGGYLTPIILATDQPNLVGLSLYLILLAAGIMLLQLKRPDWTLLLPLSIVANSILTLLGWTASKPTGAEQVFGFAILVVYWCIFHVPSLAHYRLGRAEVAMRRASEIMNSVLFLAVIGTLRFEFDARLGSGMATAAVAVLQAGSLVYLLRTQIAAQLTRRIYSVFIVVMAAAALKLAITPIPWEIMSLSALTVLFVFIGTKQKIEEIWQVACLLFIPIGLLVVANPKAFTFYPLSDYHLLWTVRTAFFAVPAAAIIGVIAMLRPNASKNSLTTQSWLHVGWIVLLFLLLSAETNDYFRSQLALRGKLILSASNVYVNRLMVAVVWMFLAVPVVVIGVRRKITAMVVAGIGVGAASILLGVTFMLRFDPVSEFTLLLNVRFATAILILAGVYTITRALRSFDHRLTADVIAAGRVCIALIPLVLLSVEAWDAFGYRIHVANSGPSHFVNITQIENQRQLVLSGIWLIYSLILIAVGIFKRLQPVRLMAIGLFALAILKIFIYDLSFLQTLYRIFSFVGLGLILLAVSYAYQRYRDIIFAPKSAKAPGDTFEKQGHV